jgi:hypothetical protein
VDSIAAARAKAYRIHLCKMGADVAIDIERIRAIHASLPAGESVTYDANRAWLPDPAIQVMGGAREHPAYYEQPCEAYEECLAIRRATTQPIILNETIQAFGDVLRAQQGGACEAIGLKIGRVGGLTKARPTGAKRSRTAKRSSRRVAPPITSCGSTARPSTPASRPATDEAERQATALEECTEPEPLPRSDYYMAWGRALAAFGRDPNAGATLASLKTAAEAIGLTAALPAIERAPDGAPCHDR